MRNLRVMALALALPALGLAAACGTTATGISLDIDPDPVLMQAVKESGFADNTVTIVTGGHGDMLGERGLWFKMNWFENSARIPLIVGGPGFKAGRVGAAVSQIDILPTLLDLARDGKPMHEEVVTEGRSLVPHLTGGQGHDEVIGEYMGEGAKAPGVMIRRGRYKFIHFQTDPDQLYDVAADPLEVKNLAADPAHAAQVAALRAEIAKGWDMEGIRQLVVASQRRRRYLNDIIRAQNVAWDYQPVSDARNLYIRNTVPIFELELGAQGAPDTGLCALARVTKLPLRCVHDITHLFSLRPLYRWPRSGPAHYLRAGTGPFARESGRC